MTVTRPLHVIQIVPSYFPATYWGGPIYSTKMICDEVAKREGILITVLTTDAAGPFVSQSIDPSSTHFPYPVFFCRRIAGHSIAPGLFWKLYQGIASADVVHVTATFSFTTLPAFLLARLLDKPLIWSPRGAVQATDEWQDSPRRSSKRLFLEIARKIAPLDLTIHVTADCERIATEKYFPAANYSIIPNGVNLPNITHQHRRVDDQFNLMFLSRIHPKKGIENLIHAMNDLPVNFSLDVYGTGDVAYLEYIRSIAVGFGDRVRLHGEIQGAEKLQAFSKADLFILPSFSENFGIVVAEALAHGVPVVTTTATPWGDLEKRGCGLSIDPYSRDLPEAILKMAEQNIARMGSLGREWMAHEFSATAVGDAFEKLYRQKAALYG